MLLTLKPCFKETITIKSDGNNSDPKWIRTQIPTVQTKQIFPTDEKIVDEQGKEFDQLFAINNTFAKISHTWSRKSHIAWINKYKIK